MTKGIRRMADPDIPYPPSLHPADKAVETIADLARWLGGATSWTGDFLQLLAMSGPRHREALRRAAPRAVRAWEAWYSASGTLTGAELASLVDGETPGAT